MKTHTFYIIADDIDSKSTKDDFNHFCIEDLFNSYKEAEDFWNKNYTDFDVRNQSIIKVELTVVAESGCPQMVKVS